MSESRIQRSKLSVVKWSALSVAVISVVAFGALHLLTTRYQFFRLKSLMLYVPAPSAAGLGLFVYMVASVAEKCRDGGTATGKKEVQKQEDQTGNTIQDPVVQSDQGGPDPGVQSDHGDPDPEVLPVPQLLNAVVQPALTTSPFDAVELKRVDLDIEAMKRLFAMATCDAQGLRDIAVQPLQVMQFLLDTVEDEELKQELTVAFKIQQLRESKECTKSQLIQMIQAHLKQGRTLLLPAGWVADPMGHFVLIRHTPDGNGFCRAEVINRQQSAIGHTTLADFAKEKSYNLILGRGAIASTTDFFSVWYDLQYQYIPGTEEQTSYTSQHFSHVMLPLWPSRERSSGLAARTTQRSGNCSYKPFIAWIKDRKGEKKGNLIKAKIQFKLFELLLEQEWEGWNLAHLEEAMNKFNRSIYKKREMIPPEFKESVTDLRQRFIIKIQEERDKRSSSDPFINENVEVADFAEFTIKTADGFVPTKSEGLLTVRPKTVLKGEWYEQVKECRKIFDEMRESKQGKKMVDWAEMALRLLPNPSDSYWNNAVDLELLEDIAHMVEAMIAQLTPDEKRIAITPTHSILILKFLAISLRQSEAHKVPATATAALIDLLGGTVATASSLNRPPDITLARTFFDTMRFFNEKQPSELTKPNSEAIVYFRRKEMMGLNDIKSDPELNFVYDQSKRVKLPKDYQLFQNQPLRRFYVTYLRILVRRQFRIMRKGVVMNEKTRAYLLFRNMTYMSQMVAFISGRSCGERTDSAGLYGGARMMVGAMYKSYLWKQDSIAVQAGFEIDSLNDPSQNLYLDSYFKEEHLEELSSLLRRSHLVDDKGRELQNEQLQHSCSKLGLSAALLQDFLAILTYDETMPLQLVSFYQNNLALLDQPLHRAIFAHILFMPQREGDRLAVEVAFENLDVRRFVFQYLHQAIGSSKRLKWYETELFLTSMRLQLLTIANFPQQEVDRALQSGREILDRSDMSVEQKGRSYARFVAVASYIPQESPLFELCNVAFTKLNESGAEVSMNDAPWLKAEARYGKHLMKILIPPQKSRGTIMLPDLICDHDDYIFSGQNFAITKPAGNQWKFQGPTGDDYIIEVRGSDLITFRLFGDVWYRLTKESPLHSHNNKHYAGEGGVLRCNVHNWISLDQPHAIVKSRVDDRTLVIVEEERVCHPTDSKLTLATEFTIKSKAMLHWIEYKRNILPWNLDGNLVRFELTSLGIAFIRKEDRWHCLQAPGFFIDEDQSFELRGELHGIVLRNSAGKRKLLMKNKMPRYSARKALEKEVSWGDPNEVWPLFFDLEDSTIKASSDPINQVALFLYYTHCERYELAKTLLRQIKREDAEWPKKLLNWIPARGRGQANSNIDAISLRLQLALEVKKRNKRCNLKDYQSDYEEYLRKLSSAQRCPLSEGEERRLLRELSKKEAFKRRQAILDGTTYTPPKPPIQLAIENLHIDHISLDPEQIEEMKQHRSQPAVVPLKINPGSAFAKNFLYYYDCLEPNSPKEGGIKVLLLRSFFMSSGLNCSLHKLLCKIALNPRYWRRLDVDNLEEDLGRLVNSMQNEKALHCPRTEKGERKVGNENVPQLLKSRLQVSEVRVHSAPTTDEIDLKFLVEKRANENAAAQQACLKGLKRVYQDSGFEGQKILAALERKSVEQECYVVKGDAGAQLEQLNRIAQQLEQDSARKREALLELHRRVSGDHRLERDGLVFQPLTLNELVVAFARKDDRRIFEANPYQSAENVHDLKKMLEEFLLIENERNQVIAAIKQVEKIGHEPDAEAKLVQIVLAKRYSQRNPALLAFEYFGKIRLREEQVEKLLQLDTTGNLEIEARTGFGKSKVLIPLWLFLTSQKGQISMMTVPASLLVMQQNHLRAVLGETFDQCVSVIRFNRSKANNVEYLRRLYERLESAKEEGRAILISIRDLHSITNLKLKELYFEKHENEAENLPIKEAEDVKMLLSMLSNFIDESRECLDIQHFYDYAIGVPEPIDREFCRTIWDFYNQAIPLILNKYSLNFCPNKNPELTEELYDSVVKKMLAEHFAEGDLALDLMGNPPAGIVYPEDEELKERHAVYKELIAVKLKSYLLRKCNESYGLSKGSRQAIPLKASVVKPNSEFSYIGDTVSYTIQASLKRDFELNEMNDFVRWLQVEQEKGGIDAIANTDQYKLCCKLGIRDLLNVSPEQIEGALTRVNRDRQLRMEFIRAHVLPRLTYYPKKISSSPYHVLRTVNRTQAASGTTNPETVPSALLPSEEDKSALLPNLMALYAKSERTPTTLEARSSQQSLDKLIEKMGSHTVLIEAAGMLCDMEPEEVAKTLSERLKKPVLYFDKQGRELIWRSGADQGVLHESHPVDPKALFFYIPQWKVVGTDTVIPTDAKAYMTVCRGMQQDLFFQAVGRMRALRFGQSVDFAVHAIQQHYFPNLEELLRHVSKAQEEKKKQENFFALQLYVDELLDEQAMANLEDPETVSQYVKETQSRPITRLTHKRGAVPIEQALAQLRARLTTDEQVEAFNRFKDEMELPEEIVWFESDDRVCTVDVDVEAQNHVEVALDQEAENDVELEMEDEGAMDLPEVHFTPATPQPFEGLEQLFSGESQNLLGIKLFHSYNSRSVSKDRFDAPNLRKRAYQLVLKREGDQISLAVIDLADLRELIRQPIEAPYTLLQSGKYLTGEAYEESIPVEILERILRGKQCLHASHEEWLAEQPREEIEPLIHFIQQISRAWPHSKELISAIQDLTPTSE